MKRINRFCKMKLVFEKFNNDSMSGVVSEIVSLRATTDDWETWADVAVGKVWEDEYSGVDKVDYEILKQLARLQALGFMLDKAEGWFDNDAEQDNQGDDPNK